MELKDEELRESYLRKPRESNDYPGHTLEATIEELVKTKEELKRAKDSATQSWLDSKPLIDELERLKAGLATAKNRCSMSNVVVSELESQLETIAKSIMAKKEEEMKATRMINELSQALDETREELETLKVAIDEERKARSKLKLVLRVKRQTLRTSQLTLRAARIEIEAFGASAAEALGHIKIAETNSMITVQLSHEDYLALKKRAKEETSLAEWRVSVSTEQREAAEASRNFALSRLKESYSENKLRRRRMKAKRIIGDEETTKKEAVAEQDLNIDKKAQENRGSAFPKARAKVIAECSRGNPEQMRRSRSNNNKKSVKKSRSSIFHRIRSCILRSIRRLFG